MMLTEIQKREYDNKFCIYGFVEDPTVEQNYFYDQDGNKVMLRKWVCLNVYDTIKQAKDDEKIYKTK